MAAAPNADRCHGRAAVPQEGRHQRARRQRPRLPGRTPSGSCSVLVDVVLMKLKPADLDLNSEGKPAGIFNQTIHDNCERRGHFENGEFVYEFGSEEEKKGYCLYPLGCRGPQTKSNCGVVHVERPSQLVRPGRRPLHRLLRGKPQRPGPELGRGQHPVPASVTASLHIGDWDVQPTTIAVGVTGIVAAALVVHGFGMKATGRMDGGADVREEARLGCQAPREVRGHLRGVRGRAPEDVQGRHRSRRPQCNQGREVSHDAFRYRSRYPYRGPSAR